MRFDRFDLVAVHGGWTAWEEGECLGTCFAATKTNRRYCTKPAPRYEGRNCSGPSEEVFKCIPKDCNCEWTVTPDSSNIVLLSLNIPTQFLDW